MNQLNKAYLSGRPEETLLALPERVLQFGTGVLLRGLPDMLIDRANRSGYFNGRVVVIKSTDLGDTEAFSRQDNLYTLCIRGIEQGQTISENIVSTAISRVLSANQQWSEVLACVHNTELKVIISNTTEVGIQLLQEDINQSPPASYPAKLLSLLLERYRVFKGSPESGMIIVPTELVPDNGALLESVVFELAHLNGLPFEFIEWIEKHCTFCNSLVDRIVPGQPYGEAAENLFAQLGYRDQLLTVAEPYCFWAIEGGAQVAEALSFAKACPQEVVIAPDINLYRERKLRLLNGVHTLSCGLAHLAGFATVSEAMAHPYMSAFIERLMLDEVAPAIPYPLPQGEAETFGRIVLDRFRNPNVQHLWLSITVQYSAKMQMRNLPVLLEHYRHNDTPPSCFALGFAAFLCFFRQPDYPVQDTRADWFYQKWAQSDDVAAVVKAVLADEAFWGTNLSALPGFTETVTHFALAIADKGARQVIQETMQYYESENTANTPAR